MSKMMADNSQKGSAPTYIAAETGRRKRQVLQCSRLALAQVASGSS